MASIYDEYHENYSNELPRAFARPALKEAVKRWPPAAFKNTDVLNKRQIVTPLSSKIKNTEIKNTSVEQPTDTPHHY